MIVFVVMHERPDPAYDGDDTTDVKFIGVYSNRGSADKAVERLRAKSGFCRFPNGFSVDTMQLDQTSWEDGFDAE